MLYHEKLLYHQIHPLKLSVDIFCTFLALFFVWEHEWLKGAITAFIPSMLMSMYVIKYSNLEPLKQSRLGKYIHGYMTKQIEYIRTAGLAVAAGGAWMNDVSILGVGLIIILATWLAGFFTRKKV
jgi:hypothetical protein